MPINVILVLGDDDADRKVQAEVLLNAYHRELERRRLQAGIQGVIITDDGMLVLIPLSDLLMLPQTVI